MKEGRSAAEISPDKPANPRQKDTADGRMLRHVVTSDNTASDV